MTTWPSANKATTTDIDSGTDNPNLSRAQIKKDIDNTNTIIDTFDMSSINDTDILAYSTADSKFTGGNKPIAEARLSAKDDRDDSTFAEIVSGNSINGTVRFILTEETDRYNFVSLRSDSTGFILEPGKYFIEVYTANNPNPPLYIYPQFADAGQKQKYLGYYQGIVADTEYEIRRDYSSGIDTGRPITIKITRIGG